MLTDNNNGELHVELFKMSTHEDALEASSSKTQRKPTPETWVQWGVDVVRLWLDGWLVGRSGYTGMRGPLFV